MAGSAEFKQWKTVWNRAVLWGQFVCSVYSVVVTKMRVDEDLSLLIQMYFPKLHGAPSRKLASAVARKHQRVTYHEHVCFRTHAWSPSSFKAQDKAVRSHILMHICSFLFQALMKDRTRCSKLQDMSSSPVNPLVLSLSLWMLTVFFPFPSQPFRSYLLLFSLFFQAQS